MNELRRFIAGATCPNCGKLDKLFLRDEGALRLCECVSCGWRDALERAGGEPAAATGTGDAAQPVRIVER